MLSRRNFLGTSIALLGMINGCSVHLPVIRKMQGGVRVNDTPATFDTRIHSGDTITTETNSSVVCVIGDNAYQLGENSQMQIHWRSLDDSWGQLIRPSYAEDGTFVNTLRMISGTLTSVFGSSEKQIHIPSATIGIRGTGVFIKINSDSTYFCTCYGQTQVTTKQSSQQIVSATHHKAFLLSHDTNNPTIISQDLKFHQDSDLYPLVALVGKQLPVDFK
ncbi:MAG: hypothetical protein BWK79_16390 [Beggiatoa sp. IS2]|nr:MAG: hypothetical protein BWK79_16390 [Beggiatoa sp. IS2]